MVANTQMMLQYEQIQPTQQHSEVDEYSTVYLDEYYNTKEQLQQPVAEAEAGAPFLCTVQVMDSKLSTEKIQPGTPNRCILKTSSSKQQLEEQRQQRVVRFSLSDEEDDSSLVSPSCIYIYENPLSCAIACPGDDSSSSSSSSNSSCDNDDYSWSSFCVDNACNSIKRELWWTFEEKEQIRINAFEETNTLRTECKPMIRNMLHCYKNCKHLTEITAAATDDDYMVQAAALEAWVASNGRGLEYTVTQKFKQSSQKIIGAILDYQEFIMEEKSRHESEYEDDEEDDEHDDDNDSVTTTSSDQCTTSREEDPFEEEEIAEFIASQSIKLSHRSRVFAHLLALADAQYVEDLQ